jgi:hypothetical protein
MPELKNDKESLDIVYGCYEKSGLLSPEIIY